MLNTLVPALLAALLVLLSLSFSAAECAFLSINKLRLRFLRLKKHNRRAALCARLLANRDRLLHTLLIGNNIANTALASVLTALALNAFGAAGVPAAIAVSTCALLLFGEIAPKTIAARYPEPAAFFFAPFAAAASALFTPLTSLFALLARAAAGKGQPGDAAFTQAEIESFIDIGEEAGVLEKRERLMMRKALSFTERCARDIMKPRTAIVSVPLGASYRAVLELSERSRFSRFPVRADGAGIDNVLGMLYVKDMLACKERPEDFSVRAFMRAPLFIPGTKKIASAQQTLRDNRQSLAVVIDEYSGTAGLLSIEDIASEIFGAVADEYAPRRAESIRQTAPGDFVCDASARLSDAAEASGAALESQSAETLGGFLMEKLGAVPRAGDSVRAGGALITALEADEKRAVLVRIQRTPPAAPPAPPERA